MDMVMAFISHSAVKGFKVRHGWFLNPF